MSIKWNDQIALGIDVVDQEHMALVSLMNQVSDMLDGRQDRSQTADVILQLEEYCSLHFQHEEELMRSAGYPGLDDHIAIHRRFTARVNEFSVQCKDESQDIDLPALHNLIEDWLINHIQKTDREYLDVVKPYLEATGPRMAGLR